MSARTPAARAARLVLAAMTLAALTPAASGAGTADDRVMPRIVADGTGGVFCAWFGDNGTGPSLIAQHLDASGDAAPGWPARGYAMPYAGYRDNVTLLADGAGGAYVAWDQGYDYGEVTLRHVRADRPALVVSDAGRGHAKAPGATTESGGNGTLKHDVGDAFPALAPDGAGGAYVVWRNSSQIWGDKVMIQRWAADGAALAPVWPAGVQLSVDWYVRAPIVIADGTGGAFVAWVEGWPAARLELAHVRDDGSPAAGWPSGGRIVRTAPADAPGLVSDGAGGVIVAWSDPQDATAAQVFAQRVTADGAMLWDTAGVRVCAQPASFGPNPYGWYGGASARRGTIVSDDAGGALFAWTDMRAGVADIYAQRITADGVPATGWAVDGMPVCTSPGEQTLPAIASDGAGGAYVAWQDASAPEAPTLRWHRIDGTGRLSYGEAPDGALLSATPIANWLPALAADAANGATAIWADASDTTSAVRVAHVFAGAHTAGRTPTSVTLASDRNPGRVSRTVTLTATVRPAAARGTIRFSAFGHVLGVVPVVDGVASTTLELVVPGMRTITAEYSGDDTYAASGGFLLQQTLARVVPSLGLGLGPNPALTGRGVTATALMPADATGAVEFRLDGEASGTRMLGRVPIGTGTLRLDFMTPADPGTYMVTASYAGDTLYTPALTSWPQTVYVRFPSRLDVMTTSNPSTTRDIEILARHVPPAPDGTPVEFFDAAVSIGTAPLTGGIARVPYHAPAFGNRTLRAVYGGDAEHDAATGSYVATFVGRPVQMTLDCPSGRVVVGDPVEVVASLEPAGATGTVTFQCGGVTLGTATVTAGTARLSCRVGESSYATIDAAYSGDTTYSACAQSTQLDLQGVGTSLALRTSANPILAGSHVRFTAVLSPAVNTGRVEFAIDGVYAGAIDVVHGEAALTRSDLTEGTHLVSASFPGSPVYRASYSNAIQQRMLAASTAVPRVLSPNDGERWEVGRPATIAWDAASRAHAPRVSLYLARTGAFAWEPIARDVPNTGAYTWTVTGPGTDDVASAFVEVVDEGGFVGGDQSDLPFTIADVPTAVTVTRLDAEAADFGIRVTWALSGAGFANLALERAPAEDGPWTALDVARRDGDGVTVAEDRTAIAGARYWYRLVGTAADGARSVFGPIEAAARAPLEFTLGAPRPNPSRGPVALDFSVARAARVRLEVLDLQGRVRSVLADGDYPRGRYRAQWDGRDGGAALPAGVYYVRFAVPGHAYTTRVAIVH